MQTHAHSPSWSKHYSFLHISFLNCGSASKNFYSKQRCDGQRGDSTEHFKKAFALDFDVTQLRAVISIMINAIVAVSNPHALANSSKINRTDHISRLKHDTKPRKEGRRNEKKWRKKKDKEERKDRTVRDIRFTKEDQKLSPHQSSQVVPVRPYGKGRRAVKQSFGNGRW